MAKMRFCSNCKKQTLHKRCLGFGTLFAVLITLGWWILAIPFYPMRCIRCGQKSGQTGQTERTLREANSEDIHRQSEDTEDYRNTLAYKAGTVAYKAWKSPAITKVFIFIALFFGVFGVFVIVKLIAR